MPDFQNHPGYLFVAATLLPLASFLLVFLFCGVWALARRSQNSRGEPEGLFKTLDAPLFRRLPAWVALGAIAGAFLLSLTGFLIYNTRVGGFQHEIEASQAKLEAAEHRIKELPGDLATARTKLKAATGDEVETAKAEVERLEQEEKDKKEEIESEEQRLEDLRPRLALEQDRWKESWEWVRLPTAAHTDPERASTLRVGYAIDTLAAVMFVMVTFIASLIHLFSVGYMSEELPDEVVDHQVETEPDQFAVAHHGHGDEAGGHHGDGHHGHYLHRRGRFGRFFMYLSLFSFSMLNLVLADNLFQVFVSWELVGICSYLLIGFYFERTSASNAANKAFITNRIGDAGFIIGLLIIWSYLGTFNFEEIFGMVRSPVRDSHGELKLAGQIVRADPVPESSGEGRKLRIVSPGEAGSEVVLFPRDRSGHFHGQGPRIEEGHDHGHGDAKEGPAAKAEHGEKMHVEGKEMEVRVWKNPEPKEYSSMPYWVLVVGGLGIFMGCVGKSAQFPLQVWLPDAMEGPTPVSALIHAATMVAAGVYLVGRSFPLFTPEVLLVIAYTGAITLFLAATIAIVMTDIKKVLAYSTVSQLGYMMLALGVGGWVAGLFHLVTHAFFKALLFLGSGSVILGCHHEQEMTKMGGLYSRMKITALTMLMGVLAIAGTPGFSGWYSKDSILAQAAGYFYVHPQHALLFLLPLLTAGITTFYMFRMWLMTFTGKPRDEHVHETARESPWQITVPLALLATFSVCVAWGWPFFSTTFPFLDATGSALEHNLHRSQPTSVLADFGVVHGQNEEFPHEAAKQERLSERHWAHEFHNAAGWAALVAVAVGIAFAFSLYYYRVLDPADARDQFPVVYTFLQRKWYFDELYSVLLVRPAIIVARRFRSFDLRVIDGILHAIARGTVGLARLDRRFDNGVVDGLVNLVGNVVYNMGARLRVVQTGFIRNYILFLVLAAVGAFVALSYFVAVAS
jgi:NADH-quinone oxidoreductase subunit L